MAPRKLLARAEASSGAAVGPSELDLVQGRSGGRPVVEQQPEPTPTVPSSRTVGSGVNPVGAYAGAVADASQLTPSVDDLLSGGECAAIPSLEQLRAHFDSSYALTSPLVVELARARQAAVEAAHRTEAAERRARVAAEQVRRLREELDARAAAKRSAKAVVEKLKVEAGPQQARAAKFLIEVEGGYLTRRVSL